MEITRQLVTKCPTGPLFRNNNGKPWTTEAVNCALGRARSRIAKQLSLTEIPQKEVERFAQTLQKDAVIGGRRRPKTDRELLQESRRKLKERQARTATPKFSLYALRHAWATRALRSGVDPLTVAILMGHSDPSMLAKVYQHLALAPEHLQGQLKRVGD